MRSTAAALVAALLCGCMSDGTAPGPTPSSVGVYQTVEGKFDGIVHPLKVSLSPFLPPQPVTTGFRAKGQGSILMQYPAQPHIWADGEIDWEPIIPGQESQVMQDQAEGLVRFTGGQTR